MGRSVLVTGANSGIGLATALELAAAGYTVTGTVRSAAKAQVLAGHARRRGVQVRPLVFDVSDPTAAPEGWREVVAATGGGPWALVNNAGFAQAGAVEDVTDDDARTQLEVNVLAPARLARLALPGMRATGAGRIVNVSSVAGRSSLPLMGWYCASKHALEALTDALRMELAGTGVKVVLVEPGSFGTGIWSGASYPDAAGSAYADAYERARAATGSATRWMPDPVWVARTIRLALAAPVPLPRYLVGADAVGLVAADRLVPTALSDLVKGLAAGVRRLPGRRRPGRR